jgi:tRNA(Arg) A34 adenosine deaminase TadA
LFLSFLKEIMSDKKFMQEAIELSVNNVKSGKGGPFGAVVVKDGKIIARAANSVTLTNDPTAHAEVNAIREACKALNTFQLTGCEIYTSCEPCPMCLGAIYWARPDRVFYANTKKDAAEINFDDDFIYQEIAKPLNERNMKFIQLSREEALVAFDEWKKKSDKIEY